eukprot:533121-Hanusia_phi.AAC.2
MFQYPGTPIELTVLDANGRVLKDTNGKVLKIQTSALQQGRERCRCPGVEFEDYPVHNEMYLYGRLNLQKGTITRFVKALTSHGVFLEGAEDARDVAGVWYHRKWSDTRRGLVARKLQDEEAFKVHVRDMKRKAHSMVL